MIYREIIQKEIEKHQLIEIGAITDLCEVVKTATTTFDTEKNFTPLVKIAYLNYFYKTVIAFSRFIDREKASNEQFKRYCRQKVTGLLDKIRREEPALLDQELKTGSGLTIAYHLSGELFRLIYRSFCESGVSYDTPSDIYNFFSERIRNEYPLELDAYIQFLEKDDPSFWDVTCRYIQDLAATVGSFALQKLDRPMYHDIIADNTWSDTYEIMRRRLVNQTGNVPVFHTGKDFRNYIIKTCHFLISNLHKKHTGKESNIEDYMLYGQDRAEETEEKNRETQEFIATWEEMDEQPVEVEMESDVKVLDIDVHNPYEVAYAVSIILLNANHPLHTTLIEGIEDKVAVLIEKTVNGMNYNDIVLELYGDEMGKDEFRRAVAKARKDYERVRKTLTDRLVAIIEKKKK